MTPISHNSGHQKAVMQMSPTLRFTPLHLPVCYEAQIRLVSPTALQGALTQPSDYLYKYCLSPSFTLFNSVQHFLSVFSFTPLLWLLLFLLSLARSPSLCPPSPVFLTELSLFLSVAKGSWLPCWCRCLKLWGPRGHQSWKSPFPPTVQPVGDKISWETAAADKS